MILYFLKNKPKIEGNTINVWTDKSRIGKLFLDFLKFYGNKFNHTSHKVSINTPDILPQDENSVYVYLFI